MIVKSEQNTYEVNGKTVVNVDSGQEIPASTKMYRRVMRFAKGERTPELERRFKE